MYCRCDISIRMCTLYIQYVWETQFGNGEYSARYDMYFFYTHCLYLIHLIIINYCTFQLIYTDINVYVIRSDLCFVYVSKYVYPKISYVYRLATKSLIFLLCLFRYQVKNNNHEKEILDWNFCETYHSLLIIPQSLTYSFIGAVAVISRSLPRHIHQ